MQQLPLGLITSRAYSSVALLGLNQFGRSIAVLLVAAGTQGVCANPVPACVGAGVGCHAAGGRGPISHS